MICCFRIAVLLRCCTILKPSCGRFRNFRNCGSLHPLGMSAPSGRALSEIALCGRGRIGWAAKGSRFILDFDLPRKIHWLNIQ
jgi:hypothetical protein